MCSCHPEVTLSFPEPTFLAFSCRVAGVIRYLRKHNPTTQLVVWGILPRGNPQPSELQAWPSIFTPAIHLINNGLRAYAHSHNRHVHFVDCGDKFISPAGVSTLLMHFTGEKRQVGAAAQVVTYMLSKTDMVLCCSAPGSATVATQLKLSWLPAAGQ